MPIILTPTSSDIDDIVSPFIRQVVTTPTTYHTPFGLTAPIVQVTPVAPLRYTIDIDTGMNDSYLAQEQMTKYLLERMTSHWMKEPEMKNVLKFMKVSGDTVSVVKDEKEYESNDISNDAKDIKKMKGRFIRDNILGKTEMRKILIKIMRELDFKWKNLCLPREENVVMKVTRKFIKKHFKNSIGMK